MVKIVESLGQHLCQTQFPSPLRERKRYQACLTKTCNDWVVALKSEINVTVAARHRSLSLQTLRSGMLQDARGCSSSHLAALICIQLNNPIRNPKTWSLEPIRYLENSILRIEQALCTAIILVHLNDATRKKRKRDSLRKKDEQDKGRGDKENAQYGHIDCAMAPYP
ncbi:hypothetical protein FH972_025761 [Carpinus fangiana]|uniref:Uncharacterized protein n=1 Tax=Carpinus fangiana TaxID=176857 RepID=A0A5N6L219_9ROSI|nr:hypothetical protein FH972_025761 [Carpinus fangiana]